MAQNRSDYVLNLIGKSDELVKALSAATASLDSVKKKASESKVSLVDLAASAAAAYGTIKVAIHDTVSEFYDAEKSARRLDAALKSQGVSKYAADYEKLTKQISELTGQDDDAVRGILATNQALLGSTKITNELATAAADLAANQGIDLAEAFQKITRTVTTGTNALSRLGIVVQEGGTKAQRYKDVIAAVEGGLHGQAIAAQTGEIHFLRLGNAVNDLKKKIGAEFAPTLEIAAKLITDLVRQIENNPGLVKGIAAFAAASATIFGFAASINAATYAAGLIKSAFAIVGSEVGILGTGLALTVGEIALVIAAIASLAIFWKETVSSFVFVGNAVIGFFQNLGGSIGQVVEGGLLGRLDLVKSGFNSIGDAAKKSATDAAGAYNETLTKLKGSVNYGVEFGPGTKKAQDDSETESLKNRHQRERELTRAQNELIKLEIDRAAKERIDLKQKEVDLIKQIDDKSLNDKTESARAQMELLRQQLEENRILQETAETNDHDRKVIFYTDLLANNEQFNALSTEQAQQFIDRNYQQLSDQIVTERTSRDAAALETVKSRLDLQNKQLLDQQKYGAALAAVSKALNSDQVKATKEVSGELIQLTQSRNETLKTIGKIAAVANIAINTAEAASSMAAKITQAVPFPYNIPLIATFVGARIAFGAEQISNVLSANSGGLVPGSGPNQDSVHAYLTPGEFVTPRNNADEVINAVAAQRSGTHASNEDVIAKLDELKGALSGPTTVAIKSDGPNNFVAELLEKLNYHLQFENGRLYGVS